MISREALDRLKKVQDRGSLGEKLLAHIEQKVEARENKVVDEKALRLADFLKPMVERGGCVFREDIEDRVDPELLRVFDEVGKVSGALRKYVGPFQVVELIERAKGLMSSKRRWK